MAEPDRLQITGAVEVWRGKAYPLGATHDGSGTNFALFSEVAQRVELCLFDSDGAESPVALPDVDSFVWHGFGRLLWSGQRYGYRVHRRSRTAGCSSFPPPTRLRLAIPRPGACPGAYLPSIIW